MLAVVATAAALFVLGACTPAQKTALTAGGGAFLQCAKQDVHQIVSGSDKTLLETVSTDLLAGEYLQSIEDLITKLGNDAVGCAVVAVETVVSAGKPTTGAAPSPIEVRALELIAKHRWTLAKT